MSRILIRNADWVLTLDDERRIIADGAIEIVDDGIAFVGKSSAISSGPGHDEVIDARGHIVVPGFIDTHVHNTQHLGRGQSAPHAQGRLHLGIGPVSYTPLTLRTNREV